MRRMASPSKSGMVKAMAVRSQHCKFEGPMNFYLRIIEATSDCEIGIIPFASIGTLELTGQRLQLCQHASNLTNRLSIPCNIGVTRVEREIELHRAIRVDTNVHWTSSVPQPVFVHLTYT